MNDSLDNTSTQADHLEKLKRQAKQRFIGAAILLLLAVIAIPFVLSSPPRVVSSDIVIDIPKIDAEPAKVTPAQPSAPIAASTVTAPLVFVPDAEPSRPAPPMESKPHDDGAKAAALLSGTDSKPNKAVKSKYVVQAGSYTDDAKLQAASNALTQAGIKHYTQAATAKDGSPRTRLRLVGPFDTREEANRAAAKVAKLGVASIVLKP